jgi:hypothetical protein
MYGAWAYVPAAGWMMVPSVIKSDPGNEGTLRVILHTELGVDVILGRSTPGERRKNNTMRQGQSADLERSEESRRLGGRGHLSRSNSSRDRVFQEARGEVWNWRWLVGVDASTSRFLYPRVQMGRVLH